MSVRTSLRLGSALLGLTLVAAGPWADIFLEAALGKPSSHRLLRSKGIHVLVPSMTREFALTMATGLLPLTIFWDRFAATPSLLLGAMLLVGIGTGTWSNFGPMLAELFPTQVRNSAMSSVLNVSRGAQFGAPVLITLLEPRYGLSAGIGLAAGFAVAAAALIWTLPETRARTISA